MVHVSQRCDGEAPGGAGAAAEKRGVGDGAEEKFGERRSYERGIDDSVGADEGGGGGGRAAVLPIRGAGGGVRQ